jgi:hypothetical protein
MTHWTKIIASMHLINKSINLPKTIKDKNNFSFEIEFFRLIDSFIKSLKELIPYFTIYSLLMVAFPILILRDV